MCETPKDFWKLVVVLSLSLQAHHRPYRSSSVVGIWSAYFLRIPRKAFSFEESSGIFSVTAMGKEVVVSVDLIEAVIDGAGELRTVFGPEEDDAILSPREQCRRVNAHESYREE